MSDITENEIIEEIVQVEVDNIVEDSINKPLDSEPEPIADYSENEVIDATDINDEVISDMGETPEQVAEELGEGIVADEEEEVIDELISDVEIAEETPADNFVLKEETEVIEEPVDSFERYSRLGTRGNPYEYSNGGETTDFVPTLLR